MQLLYNNSKVQKQCTDLKTAKKLFGGNAALATSLFARINAMLQAKEEFSSTFSTHISERILDCLIFREKQMSRLSAYVNF